MVDSWIITSLMASVLWAYSVVINGKLQVNAIRLGFWRSLFGFVASASVLLVMRIVFEESIPIINKQIMLRFTLVGILCGSGDLLLYHVVKVFKGDGPLRILNLKAPTSMLIGWCFISSSRDGIVLLGPDYVALSLTALVIALISLFFVMKNPIATKMAWITLIPVILYAAGENVSKSAFVQDNSAESIVLSIVIFNLTALVISFVAAVFAKVPLIDREEDTVKKSMTITFWWLICVFLLQISLASSGVSNAGYVSLLISFACLWAMGYNKIKGIKDEMSPVAGMGLLASTAIIIFIASQAG